MDTNDLNKLKSQNRLQFFHQLALCWFYAATHLPRIHCRNNDHSFSIFCTLKESALRPSGMCLKHYFCLSHFAVTSFILSFKCLTSTCLPSSCLCGCTESSFIPMKCAVTGSVMTGSVWGTLRGAAYYCCMFKAL